MECWSTGVLGKLRNPSLQHSITPALQLEVEQLHGKFV
jgi:hypothetical protein